MQAAARRKHGGAPSNAKGGAPINLCNITVLIGSGMLRNILFGAVALSTGFFLALSLALLKARDEWYLTAPARAFIYTFRGTPLLIQFFIGYLIFAGLGAGVGDGTGAGAHNECEEANNTDAWNEPVCE